MAFNLQAIVGTTTHELNNGSPFVLENATGVGLAPVRRYSESAPIQHGVTDLGYNYDPRIVTLALNFAATDDATLDGYRDDLNAIFTPSSGSAVQLRITRDDAAVRQIDVYATDNTIEIVPAHRPGHLHKAVVQLRAAVPSFYDPTPGTATMTAASTAWYLAGGAIGTADVLEFVDSPSPDTAWSWAGTVTTYTVAMRLQPVYQPAAAQYAYMTGSAISLRANPPGGSAFWTFYQDGTLDVYTWSQFPTIDTNYDNIFYRRYSVSQWDRFYDYDDDGVVNPLSPAYYQNGSVSVNPDPIASIPLVGVNAYWGGDGSGTAAQWGGTIARAVAYQSALTVSQMQALDIYMGITASQEAAIAYTGTTEEYPVIEITGPIVNPIITNATTGRVLDFTGSSVSAGDVYTIDLRLSALSVTDSGGTLRTNELTEDSDLGDWSIVPSPLATGGTNVVTVAGTSIGTATAVSVTYYNRYVSY